ncbi:helix-turn-helix transcriptional regulator [Streptomyces sp. NPDC057302]|uniref:helix-turn-helix domain-containing protein n=1 Tax=Streptomyces sp. NPDC057302 TaxID=3346094 RepID=UPI003631BDAE
MTPHPTAPSAGGVVAGTYLRSLRHDRQLPLSYAAEIIGGGYAMAREIETGYLIPDEAMVEDLLRAYGVVGEHHAQALMSLIRDATKGRFACHDGGPGWLSRLRACEGSASTIVAYSAWFIPGILHTPAYAALWRSVQFGAHTPTASETSARVLPAAPGKHITVLLDESVLLRAIGGPTVMADQLAHVLETVDSGDVRVRIVPMSAPLVVPPGTLSELSLTRQRLYVEEAHGVVYSTGPDESPLRNSILEHAFQVSLSPENSLARVHAAQRSFASAAAAAPAPHTAHRNAE